MHHLRAREAVSRTLAGDGFGDRTLALTLAGSLDEIPFIPEDLRERAFARSLAMVADRGVPQSITEETVLKDRRELVNYFAPALAQLHGSAGRHIASLYALTTLWPHVGGPERPGMRRRFLGGSMSLAATVGGEVGISDLRDWQRDLATCINSTSPTLATLSRLLDEPDQRRAYIRLADHLGASFAPATLCWVIGGLTVQELLHRRDRNGGLLNCLLGAMALERLAPHMSTEHLARAITQIAMQVWWWRQHGNLAPIRSCLDGALRPIGDAVRSGDITAAQRAARVVSADPAVLWREFTAVLDEAIAWKDSLWLQALSAIVALAWRSGDTLSPDDAAATATVLADLNYHAKPAQVAVLM